MQTDIPQLVLGSTVLLILLRIIIHWLVAEQARLTYPEYQTIHTVKTLLFRIADPWASRRGRPLINDKDGREDAEYLTAWDGSPRDVLTTLHAEGWDYHLISTDKRRPDGTLDGGHAVLYHDDGRQTEVYVFDAGHGMTHVYVHVETATTDPDGHLSDPQADGDPRGVVKEALEI
jgi:hypothetical protein